MDGFKACFDELADPRIGNAGRHKLIDILMIALCTVLCGGKTAVDMAEFADAKLEFLRDFLELEHGAPSHDTFSRVLRLLARVGDRDRCLHPELITRPGLPLGDAFHLWRMQGVELVSVACLLGQNPGDPFTRHGEGGFQRCVARDFTPNVAIQATQPGPHLAHPAHGLFVAATMDEPRHIASRPTSHPQEGLAQRNTMFFREPIEQFDAAHQEMAVGGMGNSLGLDRRIERHAFEGLRCHSVRLHGEGQRLGQQQLQLLWSDPTTPARHR